MGNRFHFCSPEMEDFSEFEEADYGIPESEMKQVRRSYFTFFFGVFFVAQSTLFSTQRRKRKKQSTFTWKIKVLFSFFAPKVFFEAKLPCLFIELCLFNFLFFFAPFFPQQQEELNHGLFFSVVVFVLKKLGKLHGLFVFHFFFS